MSSPNNFTPLKDIFYLPMALEYDIVSLISSRLIYKNIEERKRVVNELLYAMPIEAHGGEIYSKMCLDYATNLLHEGIDLSIFPEGAYVEENVIYKGRTGACRILFYTLSKNENKKINFIPVAIDVSKTGKDLDNYEFMNDNVVVSFLSPVDYREDYEKFITSNNFEEKNACLHHVTDLAFKSIAAELNREYVDSYIELFPKKNVIFSNGEVVSTDLAQDSYYVNMYEQELKSTSEIIKKQLVKRK